MLSAIGTAGVRGKLLFTRSLARLGFRDDAFLIIVAVLIGLITAVAAVGFHQLINEIRNLLYLRLGEQFLYGPGLYMLIVWPALGGLSVGFISRVLSKAGEGHGVIDVMESVIRTSGFVKPASAIEKILTSAITIGTGGSVGAEGPIVQIGAAIASGVGQFFKLTRQQMPTMVGCGAAAGISAIFNSPMGGLLFALEIILQDFSVRSVTPVVIASVIANVTTGAIFAHLGNGEYHAIFALAQTSYAVNWSQVSNFALLGVACGLVGVSLTRLMYWSEEWFHHIKISRVIRPALGGAILGVMGIAYVLIFGHWALHRAKPIPFHQYPMPAFFGDGYGFIQQLLSANFYDGRLTTTYVLAFLAFMCFAKIVATCITLSSGGSGGIIAPALFLGAVVGGLLGVILRGTGLFVDVQPELYALVGMAGVLAAVVHAPLASIMILLEVTRDSNLVLPAMLAAVIATGTARLIFHDSVYTLTLRQRGVRVGSAADLSLLRRITVEQVPLDPATVLHADDPLQRALDLSAVTSVTDFVVLDRQGQYAGMLTADDMKTALLQHEAIPLLLVNEMARSEIPIVRTTDDLGTVLDTFARFDVGRLPVTIPNGSARVIGVVSRAALMLRYQQALAES